MIKKNYVTSVPMLSKLPGRMHLTFNSDFKQYAENYLSRKNLDDIGFYDVYIALYNQLHKSNYKCNPKVEMNRRDDHLKQADIAFRQIRKMVLAQLKERDPGIAKSAAQFELIVSASSEALKRGIKDKISRYRSFAERMSVDMVGVERLGIKSALSALMSEVESAAKAQTEVDLIDVSNMNKRIKDIRPLTDTFYRNAMSLLNGKMTIGKSCSDIESFMEHWAEKVSEYRNEFASKTGVRISKSKKSDEEGSAAPKPPKKEKHYTLPRPRDSKVLPSYYIEPPIIPPQSDIPLYDPNKHYTEYKVGDLVRLENGDVYRVKNLGQIHYHPDSKYGHFGWEIVSYGS